MRLTLDMQQRWGRSCLIFTPTNPLTSSEYNTIIQDFEQQHIPDEWQTTIGDLIVQEQTAITQRKKLLEQYRNHYDPIKLQQQYTDYIARNCPELLL